MNTKRNDCVVVRWIGLADVRPLAGNDALGEALGAFVAVVGDAPSEGEFVSLVRKKMNDLCFYVESLDDVEALQLRRARQELPDQLELAVRGISDAEPLATGVFHSYLA